MHVRIPRLCLYVAPFLLLAACSGASAPVSPDPPLALQDDPYFWLEEIQGERALGWVEEQNEETAERLTALPLYEELYDEVLAVLNAESRLPEVTWHGDWVYDLWQDEEHPRGLLRRTRPDQLRRQEPEWQTVLDVDRLAAEEGEPWAYGGMECLPPEHRHCLFELSPGGGDAVEIREFDAASLAFVDDGFFLPTAKSNVVWRDADSLFVGTDFGPGSLTESGYPRIAKLWRRGTPVDAAETLYEGAPESVWVVAQRLRSDDGDVDLVTERLTFWTSAHRQLVDGRLERLELPETADVEDAFDGRLVVFLKEEWAIGGDVFPSDSVVIADPAALRGGEGSIDLVLAPTEGEVVQAVDVTPRGIVVTLLDDVRGRIVRLEPDGEGWRRRAIPFPDNGDLDVVTVDDRSGAFFVEYESFLTPPTLYQVSAEGAEPERVRAQEPTFDPSGLEVTQHWTTSADGTRVPYFQVAPEGLELDGENPVWMFSYGGFENSLTPSYSGSYEDLNGAYGRLWLRRGGVFVLANIRGGGEFGPEWHRAAMRENHVNAFEDFEAVARDLVERGVTSPERLGIEGRSNGGLLVGSTMLRHPELYGAVVCGSPLLDMKRYDKLLAGASWTGEYGDPDVPGDWAFIRQYSPYQNVEPGQDYPPIFIYTSTLDDRVHPGHARKMAARMEAMGYPVEYHELIEGGHGASVTHEQLARRIALTFTFLWQQLGGE